MIEDDADDVGFNNIGIEVDDINNNLKILEENNIDIEDKIINDEFKILSLKDSDNVKINLIEK